MDKEVDITTHVEYQNHRDSQQLQHRGKKIARNREESMKHIATIGVTEGKESGYGVCTRKDMWEEFSEA